MSGNSRGRTLFIITTDGYRREYSNVDKDTMDHVLLHTATGKGVIMDHDDEGEHVAYGPGTIARAGTYKLSDRP